MENDRARSDKDHFPVPLFESIVRSFGPEPFGTYLFLPAEPSADIATDLERRVFLEAFGNTPELLEAEYRPYEHTSFFVCVIDHRRQTAAAMMRIIVPRHGRQLKTIHDLDPAWGSAETVLARAGLLGVFEAERCWDIATLAVAPEYRTAAALGMMHVGLYQVIGRLGQRFGVQWLIAIFDYPVFRLMRLQLGPVFRALGEPKPYLGSLRSVPACCELPEAKRYFRRKNPALYEVLYSESAFGAALRPLDLRSASRRVRQLLNEQN